jgi:LPS export ABC transporter permease LptF/LPS export ABC transporter permease LptG
VAFLAYTGFMLVRGLVQFSDLVLQSASPLRETGSLLALSLPHIVVLTIPISFLLGLLIGVGRLSADSELIALRASGVDLVRLYRPIVWLSAAFSLVTLLIMLAVVPRTNQILYDKKLQISTLVIAQRIQPGVFSQEVRGYRIYAERTSADHRVLESVIVSDRSDPEGGERLTLARRGYLELEEDEGRLWLRLEDAVTQRVKDWGESDDRATYREQRTLLDDTNPKERVLRLSFDKQLREQTLGELFARARRVKTPVERRLAWVEIHKKFALPAACLVFGLIGLPLGIVTRRGGRAAGFSVSVVIVLVYYVLLAAGEGKAIDGSIPPVLAMWFPNLLLLAVGLWSLARARRDRPLIVLPSFPVREPSAEAGGPGRKGLRFPGRAVSPATFLLDRYVARRFLGIFTLVLASIVTLYLVIEFMEISDDIAKHRPPLGLLVRWAEALVAPILYDVTPYAFLVAALVATAGMVRSSETTAILSHGISLLRSVASLFGLAAVVGLLLFVFSDRVVPRAAAESERLRATILGHQIDATPAGGQAWFRGEGGRFFSVEAVEGIQVHGLTVLVLDPATFRMVERTDARTAVLVPGKGFAVEKGWVRRYGPDEASIGGRPEKAHFVEAPEASRILLAGRADPRLMTTAQLWKFIRARRSAGADVSALSTSLYQKSAAAMASLLLTLVGLPFAFRYGKRGAVAGVGVAILIGLAYLFTSSILTKLGVSGALPPLLAAWSANVLFGLGAAWGLLGVRT